MEVIPARLINSSVVTTDEVKWDVTAVETIGDWIMLSIETNNLEFWLIELNLCEVPIPTLVISTTSGTVFSAFSAVSAILIESVSYTHLTLPTSDLV